MHSSQTVSGFRGFQSRRRGLRKRSGEKEAADEVDRSCAGVKRDSRSAVCLSRGSRLTLGGGGPLLIVPPQHSCASPCLRTAPETAAGLIGLDRHPAAGCRPGWSLRLPDATSCASTNRCSVWSVTTRLRVLRTVRASPARSCSPRGGSARQAFPGASPEVSVPFSASGRVALSGVAVLQTIPLRRLSPFHSPTGWISAAVGGHRPCGLTLTSTAGFNPASRMPVRLGSCTVGVSGRGVPLPSRTNSRLGREVYPGSAHGVPALRSVAPAQRVTRHFDLARPPAVSRSAHPDNLVGGRSLSTTHPLQTSDRPQAFAAAPGFYPRRQSVPAGP